MSEISTLIFDGASHYVVSPFGKRPAVVTSSGVVDTLHYGVDYGTYRTQIPQYAIEHGYCFAASKAPDGAKYAWIVYPQYKLAMLHYHLHRCKLKSGDAVTKGTLVGYTGSTGRATGIHLHLGIRDLGKLTNFQILNMTWQNLQMCPYCDPETVEFRKRDTLAVPVLDTYWDGFLPDRGYFKVGDISNQVDMLSQFMHKVFSFCTPKSVLGHVYSKYLYRAIKEFQARSGLDVTGLTDVVTLNMLRQFGFSREIQNK